MLSDKPYFFADPEDEPEASTNIITEPMSLDDEHDDVQATDPEPEPLQDALEPNSETDAVSESREPLFLADSGDEDERPVADYPMNVDDALSLDPPRSSSPPVAGPSAHTSVKSLSRSPSIRETSPPPAKRRRLSLPQTEKPVFSSAYVGTFIVGNAWATARGKGYIKPGDAVRVEIDAGEDSISSSKNTSSKPTGAKDKSKKKQTTLTNAFQAKNAKPAKKKLTTIVRLTSDRGFGTAHCFRRCMRADGSFQSLVVFLKERLNGSILSWNKVRS